jgi:hypothetical protein
MEETIGTINEQAPIVESPAVVEKPLDEHLPPDAKEPKGTSKA